MIGTTTTTNKISTSQQILSSLFSIFILSTLLTVTEIYIFYKNEENVARGIKSLATSSVSGEKADGVLLNSLISHKFLQAFSAGEQARKGYKQYSYCLVVVLSLISVILYIASAKIINSQIKYITSFILLSVIVLIPFQIQFNEKVLSETEVISGDDVVHIINRAARERLVTVYGTKVSLSEVLEELKDQIH